MPTYNSGKTSQLKALVENDFARFYDRMSEATDNTEWRRKEFTEQVLKLVKEGADPNIKFSTLDLGTGSSMNAQDYLLKNADSVANRDVYGTTLVAEPVVNDEASKMKPEHMFEGVGLPHILAYVGCVKTLEQAKEAGMSMSATDDYGRNAAHYLVVSPNNFRVAPSDNMSGDSMFVRCGDAIRGLSPELFAMQDEFGKTPRNFFYDTFKAAHGDVNMNDEKLAEAFKSSGSYFSEAEGWLQKFAGKPEIPYKPKDQDVAAKEEDVAPRALPLTVDQAMAIQQKQAQEQAGKTEQKIR